MSDPRVAVIPWPGIEGAFICVSGKRSYSQRSYGSQWHNDPLPPLPEPLDGSRPCITFTYVIPGKVCAEWDGDSGPIQMWFAKERGLEHSAIDPHWIFDKAWGYGAWSQIAVKDYGLPEAFVSGDFARIFNVLKHWAKSRADEDEGDGE